MQITFSKGAVVAKASSIKDVQTLLSLAERGTTRKPYGRRCHRCGGKFIGLRGLATHSRSCSGKK